MATGNTVRLTNKLGNVIIGTEIRYRQVGGTELIGIDVHGTASYVELDTADWYIVVIDEDGLIKDLPIDNTALRWTDLSYSSEDDRNREPEAQTDIDGANIICSDVLNGYQLKHKIVLDIDHPVKVVESSPGKSHLYIDKEVEWQDYMILMTVLHRMDLIEWGYFRASLARGYTSTRVPWALKASGVRIPNPNKKDRGFNRRDDGDGQADLYPL